MWINEQLSRSEAAETPYLGRVTRVDGGRADVDSHTRLSGVECIAGFGLPAPGEEVLVLPGMDRCYCLGRPLSAAGEVELRGPGGGFLRLRSDGSVVINGLVITREGGIVPSGQEGA